MITLLATLATAATAAPHKLSHGRLTVVEASATPGSLSVLVDGQEALSYGKPAAFHSGGKWHTAGTASLNLTSYAESNGTDALGPFIRGTWTWAGGLWQTSAIVHDDSVVFAQEWTGASFAGVSVGDNEAVASVFPSFNLASAPWSSGGYLAYKGDMVGAGYATGALGTKAPLNIGSGKAGTGPLVLFTKDLKTSMVLSPFSSFMAANQQYDKTYLSYGVMGDVQSLESGFRVETILSLGEGIQSSMLSWGDKMLKSHGTKSRTAAWDRDMTLRYLGYSTDNGAYYYYHTEPGKTYEETMLDVQKQAIKEGTPYKYWLADSWWYFKGKNGGVTNWTARADVFPHGLESLFQKTGWPVQGHNRYWSNETTYAKHNGGEYDFLIDETGKYGYALPIEQRFWDDLIKNATEWGLVVYEQDWLDDEYDRFPPLTQKSDLAKQWLMQMNRACDKYGVSIQYCMSHPRHILASVELPAVTQARASGDYQPTGKPNHKHPYDQWHELGTTSMFAYALGIAPSKDNFWSGRGYSRSDGAYGNATEPIARLQSAVLTLSKGPVCPSDMNGKADHDLIMRSAAMDGTLLTPGTPAMKLDKAVASFLDSSYPSGEVWSAKSDVSGFTFTTLLSADLKKAYDVTPADLGYSDGTSLVAIEANSSTPVLFGATSASSASASASATKPSALPLSSSDAFTFQVFHIAPIFDNGFALLGEATSKWVGVSPSRFSDIRTYTDKGAAFAVRVTLSGAAGEEVAVSFRGQATEARLYDGSKLLQSKCTIPQSGSTVVGVRFDGSISCGGK